jgi:hypothetical protein
MLPVGLPESSHWSIEKISAPDSCLSGHPAFDPKQPSNNISMTAHISG